jgi:alpha-1,2-mannosyltransferase
MNAVVGHHHWGRPGGGQLVVAAAAHAFSTQREVTLAGIGKFDPARYLEWFGIDLSNFKIKTLPIALSAFGLYSRLLIWYPAEKAITSNTDVVFLDEYNYRPMLRKRKSFNFKFFEYIHFPIEKSVGLGKESDPYVTERYSRFPLNVYWEVYLKLLRLVVRKNPFETADVVLTNSKWTAKVVKDSYGELPIVLNPPIPPNVEPKKEVPPSFDERVNSVVMVGRFTEEKRYEWVIKQVASKLKGLMKFYIFGGAGTPVSIHYKNSLMSLASKVGLEGSEKIDGRGDIYFISDAPRYLINTTIDKSKVFLHATINEHWGIVVAEAMARGLPILVHKSGGAWTDLAKEGLTGLGYQTAEEAIEFTNLLCSDQNNWAHYQKEGILRTKELLLDNFTKRLDELAK